MFGSKPLRSERGLSDYLIGYIAQHTGPKARLGPRMLCAAILIVLANAAMAASLWTQSISPELLSERVVNFTGFGVVVMTLLNIAMGLLLMAAFLAIGIASGVQKGAVEVSRAINEASGRDLADGLDARQMMANRDLFKIYNASRFTRLKSGLRSCITYAFLGGMIAMGYIFAPVCIILVYIMLAVFSARARGKVLRHTKTLNPQRVAHLEEVYRKEEAKKQEKEGKKDAAIFLEAVPVRRE